MILGIDEVGRGAWAGPLVVGAVVLGGAEIEGLTDSKALSKKRREELDIEIRERAAGIGLGWVSATKIDEIGLSEALRLATKRAVQAVDTPFHEIILDGTVNFLSDTPLESYVTTMKKADLLISSVSAASIVAKVARDQYMAEQDDLYPGYNFVAHVGYGTASHREAIETNGVSPLHRLSFGPLVKYRKTDANLAGSANKITTKQIGDRAEEITAEYLRQNGHTILDRNWKTKFCEIDIVSQREDTIYFTEVKYRKNANQGGGMAAITPKKLRQMKFAAEYFALKHKLQNSTLRLCAADVSGADFILKQWLEI